jgi:hypothetical protein
MKTVTIDDMRNWNVPDEITKHFSDRWSGTVLDVLKLPTMPFEDKLLVVCREDLIDANTLRRFAIWCARGVGYLSSDYLSKHAIDVAESFIQGKATREELIEVRNRLCDRAWNSVKHEVDAAMRCEADEAVRIASRRVAELIAENEACEAMRSAKLEAVKHAAWEPAMEAARKAVSDVIEVAVMKAARDAARETAYEAVVRSVSDSPGVRCHYGDWEAAMEAAKATVMESATDAARCAAWESALALSRHAVRMAARGLVVSTLWIATWKATWKDKWEFVRNQQCGTLIRMIEEAA